MPPSPERVPTDPWPSGRCFKISWWISFIYCLGAFQLAGFALGHRVSESIYKHFKIKISVSYSLLGLLDISTFGFQSQAFEGFSLVHVPGVEMPDVVLNLLAPQRYDLHLWDLSRLYLWDLSRLWVAELEVEFLATPLLCLSYPSWCDFLFFVVEKLLS